MQKQEKKEEQGREGEGRGIGLQGPGYIRSSGKEEVGKRIPRTECVSMIIASEIDCCSVNESKPKVGLPCSLPTVATSQLPFLQSGC